MARENNAVKLRRELLFRIARLMLENRLEAGIDALPFEATRDGWEVIRCCVHHDRALIRLRLLGMLGFSAEKMSDVERPLRDYAAEAMKAGRPDAFPLTMITEACNSCAKARYLVTDACQGCFARPCKTGCPRNAVSVKEDRSHIDPERCVNCGLCEKACPFHAIIKVPVPCEETCPVGAIRKGDDGTAAIDEEKCILCGRCVNSCPFGAPAEKSELVRVMASILAKEHVTAIVAPAAMVQFPFSAGQFAASLLRLGFAEVMEAAEAADLVAEEEAGELLERVAEGDGLLATSCCPSWTRAARSIPATARHVSATPSPMIAAGMLAKKRKPETFTVFIGPCVAKKWEARKAAEGEGASASDARKSAADAIDATGIGINAIDAVLTSEEVGAMLIAASIQVNEEKEIVLSGASPLGRGFGASSGVAAAVARELAKMAEEGSSVPDVETVVVSGLTKENLAVIAAMKPLPKGKATLLEVMACDGGCINGPCAIANAKSAKVFLEKYKFGGAGRAGGAERVGEAGRIGGAGRAG